MTFWQENYGFVKEVYDYRIVKYQEWMDNLEGIVAKVLQPNIQYTYKEFKIIQDTLGSLCRDLEKEGMKEWLDMMLEKVAMRVSDEGGSARDKEFKKTEKKRLQALIERHDLLMPPTKETQEKVEIFARCYAYGDDISPTLKTLEEALHLSTKDIHPHNMNMVEEQIEKAERIISTIDGVAQDYEEYVKRGQKLLRTPNCAPFMAPLIEKFEVTWKAANEKSKERVEWLKNAISDWELYDEMRSAIVEPCEKLEGDLKKYRKFFDPDMADKKLASRKATLEECKAKATEQFAAIQKSYNTIVVLAGAEKKEFLDREVAEVEEKKGVIAKCEAKLKDLEEYNAKLRKAVTLCRELNDWAVPTNRRLKELNTSETMTPEDRVNEIMTLQAEANAKVPLLEPLGAEYTALLTVEDLELSETAKNTMAEFEDLKKFVTEIAAEIETDAGSITQDQKFYAEYLGKVKEVQPWMEEAEKATTSPMEKPHNLDAALALLASIEDFDKLCGEQKEKLDQAGKAKESMEKHTGTEDLYNPLTKRWEVVKKTAVDRIEKVKVLVNTWRELQQTTEDLAGKMNEVPKQDEPNLEELEKVFTSMKGLFAKKKELLATV